MTPPRPKSRPEDRRFWWLVLFWGVAIVVGVLIVFDAMTGGTCGAFDEIATCGD